MLGLIALFVLYSQYIQWQEKLEVMPQPQEIPLQPIIEQPISLEKIAEKHILTANNFVEKAFQHENAAQKLNLKAPREEWLSAKTSLVKSIENYQKSMEENNNAIEIVTAIQQQNLLKERKLANKLASKSMECHILTLAFIDGFMDKNMEKLKELHPEIRACIKERKQLEEVIQQI
ncbi:hypothetical protein HY484_00115 [Candidatus Woesearchaeota archaeon]|nr:hypothetical protein [Candidatus Woesearchaeota archaeon]